MARQKTSPFENLVLLVSKLPWWVGMALALGRTGRVGFDIWTFASPRRIESYPPVPYRGKPIQCQVPKCPRS